MDAPLTPAVGPGLLRRRRLTWLLISTAPLVIVVCALVPFASLQVMPAPLWLSVAAALVVFPALPSLWHFLAESKRPVGAGPGTSFDRFALRSLAIALVVLSVSVSNLGPRRVGAALTTLVRSEKSAATEAVPKVEPAAAPASSPRHELEGFIPADARMVVALSDSAILQQFLGANGADAKKSLAALEKCQITMERARVLIAARDAGTRMMVVRAAGITDPRNLYCLVGFLGNDRLSLRFTNDKAPVGFEVQGLANRALKFNAIDDHTVVAIDGAWGAAADKKLFTEGGAAEGPLAAVLARVDRGASLWSASVSQTEQGAWDLAIDARFEGTRCKLRSSSIPPSGSADEARGELNVPLGFALALPAGAFNDGIRGLVAAITATGAGPATKAR